MSVDGYLRYLTIGSSTYEVLPPIASSNSLGGIKVGSGLSITNDGTLSTTGGGGTGTVTSVGLTNGTNGGLSISGSPITSSGSITVGHSNVLSSAQTTSAVYPIKIDKNGHISEYGSAVSIPTKVSDLTNDSGFITGYTETDPIFTASAAYGISSGDITNWNSKTSNVGTITEVKTSAGAHTTIDVTSGKAEFNVPTKVSHLTNDSGFITGITSTDVTTALGYTPYDSSNPSGYTSNTGTVTSIAISNDTNGGLSVSGSPITTNGTISIGHSNVLTSAQATQAVYPIKIDKNGHISDYGSAVTIPTISLNGSSTTSPNFYAPTSAGTSGYVLTSSGSGAPSWTSATLTDEKVKQIPLNSSQDSKSILLASTMGSSETTATSYMSSSLIWSDYLKQLSIYGAGSVYNYIKSNTFGYYDGSHSLEINFPNNNSDNYTYTLPKNTGTVALTSDIPDVSGKIDTAGTGLSKSGTTLNHSNSVNAQTTSAVYPITIDAQGHIASYGNAITIPTVTVTDVTQNGTSVVSNGVAEVEATLVRLVRW